MAGDMLGNVTALLGGAVAGTVAYGASLMTKRAFEREQSATAKRLAGSGAGRWHHVG